MDYPLSGAVIAMGMLVTSCSNSQVVSSAAEPLCSKEAVSSMAERALQSVAGDSPEPGVTLAVFYPTRWHDPISVARGYADFGKKTMMKPDAAMPAGSIGKTFFGAAALKLAEDGKLDLDRPIGDILGDASIPNANRVTSRMLLSHTSGYGEYDGTFMNDLINDPLRRRERADWIGPIVRNPPAPPGTFRYSDINFVLLAEVVSAAAGEPWADYIDREFLKPFELTHTRAALDPSADGIAPGYAGPENFFGQDEMVENGKFIYNPQFESGGGGYVSSSEDLSEWIVRLAAANAYSPSTWDMASKPTHPVDEYGNTYGLGIHIDQTRVGTAYGHSGYIPGYYGWVRYYEKPGIAVAMQSNTSDDARLPWDGYDVMDSLASDIALLCGA